MSKRTDTVVDEAKAKSQQILDAIADKRVMHRAQIERIMMVCEALIRAKPAVEPRTPAISERGKMLFKDFPAEQSLLNRHGQLLRVWREAYAKLLNASVPAPRKESNSLFPTEEELGALDHGTRARVTMMAAVLRERNSEVDRLKQIITAQLPAPGQSVGPAAKPALSPADRSAIKTWIEELRTHGGPLMYAADGARITVAARKGALVVPRTILHVLEHLMAESADEGGGRRQLEDLSADADPRPAL